MPSDSVADARPPAGLPMTGEYVVVARRYRPQTFEDLVGQGHAAQALRNAITTHRVGHAYLFTGARGVGKTSTARIFAKALNCVEGPTTHPCNRCDVCLGISTGDDVDVLEIDGASNRGIEEIRQLRSNVNVRPSRARFKIYIIDEVHMLTMQAFNALLKTLEEPPEHVKFIFCTTDPEKIPITVLSRCQRFDFLPVETPAIHERLQQICLAEGVQADDEALQLLARRAGGSMRDSQSLLEQLLSYGGASLTSEDVHRMLGTAPTGRLAAMAEQILEHRTADVLGELAAALAEGIDPGQLAEQLLGYFRDLMAAAVGCPSELMLLVSPADFARLRTSAERLGLETILAMVQVLDQTLIKMRQSMHVRTLLEVALVRLCNLDRLDDLAALVQRVSDGAAVPSQPPAGPRVGPATAASGPPAALEKKKVSAEPPAAAHALSRGGPLAAPLPPAEPSREVPSPDTPRTSALEPLSPEAAEHFWRQALAELADMTAAMAGYAERIAIVGPNRLAVSFRPSYTLQKEACERPDKKVRLEQAVSKAAQRPLSLEFGLLAEEEQPAEATPQVVSGRQRMREFQRHPFVKRALELFDGEVVRMEERARGSTGADAAGKDPG